MGNVAIVTDSVSCLTKEQREHYGITIVPIVLLVQGKIYRDMVDITPSQAYKLFLEDPEKFNTSPSSPELYLNAYREAASRAKNILCITLSSKLSTGYEMARVARERARTELPGINIEVMDSLNVTASEGLIALAAARASEAGKELPDVVKIAQAVKEKVVFIAVLETIRYVYRTGRIPKIAAQFGSMLKIKPILSSSPSGTVHFVGAVRNMEQGINRLVEIMREKVGNNPVHVAVMHAFAPEQAENLKKSVESQFNCIELFVVEFSPVMGYATGTGTLGLAFYQE